MKKAADRKRPLSPFAVVRSPSNPVGPDLRTELRALELRKPGKVPVLILGRGSHRVVVMHPDDAVFLRREGEAT